MVDAPGSDGWSHLVSNDLDALHRFARSIGLHRRWFHNKPMRPHYDVRGEMLAKAIRAGAVPVSSKKVVKLLRENFGA